MNFYRKNEDILQQIYEESENIGLTRIEVDALFVISKYILFEMNKDVDKLEEVPWYKHTYESFNGERAHILNIYHSVYSFFQIPFTKETVPFQREFEQNPTIGDLAVNIKEKVVKHFL